MVCIIHHVWCQLWYQCINAAQKEWYTLVQIFNAYPHQNLLLSWTICAGRCSVSTLHHPLGILWHHSSAHGWGHRTPAVLLPGFAINWLQNQVIRQREFCDLIHMHTQGGNTHDICFIKYWWYTLYFVYHLPIYMYFVYHLPIYEPLGPMYLPKHCRLMLVCQLMYEIQCQQDLYSCAACLGHNELTAVGSLSFGYQCLLFLFIWKSVSSILLL